MSSIISGITACSLFIYRCLRFANVICSYHSIVLISRCNVLFCMQEYSGRCVVKHNFRYRVHPCSMSIIYPLLCFLNVIYAPSCNRCVLITPVPGARSPCTSPSAWGSFPDSIEPRGMHQRGAPPTFPLPPCRCNSAPAWAVPACQVRTRPRLFLCVQVPRHAPARPPTRSLPRLPALDRRAPPAAHPDRPHVFSPARPPVVSHARPARTPACFRPPLPSPSLSFPVCLPCLNSALLAES